MTRDHGRMALWNHENGRGFHFGIEAEYLLVESATYRPLWHRDLTFEELNAALETISLEDLPPLDGLDLEPPHTKLMPFAVEGYHLPAPEMSPTSTCCPRGSRSVRPSAPRLKHAWRASGLLHERMQDALGELGYRAVSMSHHPTADRFEGPQNKRRHDFWQWAMQAMVTYGPDVNVSLPADLNARLDFADLHAKVNYYAPADRSEPGLTVLPGQAVGDPRPRGQIDSNLPTQRDCAGDRATSRGGRPAGVQVLRDDHPAGRLPRLLSALAGAACSTRPEGPGQRPDADLRPRCRRPRRPRGPRPSPSEPRRSWTWARRAHGRGFDPRPLESFRHRLETGRLPADDLIELYERERSIPAVLRHLAVRSSGPDRGGGASRRGRRLRAKAGLHRYSKDLLTHQSENGRIECEDAARPDER